ncbi:hypothetical protein ES703_86419 [subsurface metagenome]
MTPEWSNVELSGYLHYSQQGYRILVPLVIQKGYDFAIEKNGRFKRINVKKAWTNHSREKAAYYILTNMHKAKKYQDLPLPEALKVLKKDCDLYLIWLPGHNKFIETTPDFLIWTRGKRCRIPPELCGDPEDQEPFRARYIYEQQTLAKDGLKRCTLCKKIKPLTEFLKVKRGGHAGMSAQCKPCHSLYRIAIKSEQRRKQREQASALDQKSA